MRPNRYSIMLMLGHFCNDICQGAVPALIPFLVAQRGISITAAGGLMFALTSLSSVIQPVCGVISDRHEMPWLMGVGIFLAGAGIACVGLFPNYWAMFAAAAVAGVGTALFHPEGGRMSNRVAGDQKGTAMSIFAVGGNLGFATGPIIALAALGLMGIRGMALFLIPTTIMALILLNQSKKMIAFSHREDDAGIIEQAAPQSDNWRAFGIVAVAIFCRVIASNSLTTFVPLFWNHELGQSEAASSAMLTLNAVMSAVGTLAGGRLADRFGYTRVIRVAMVIFAPTLFLLASVKSAAAGTVLIIPAAIAASCAYSPSVVLGQKFLPNRLGLATGITLGLAVSIGGIAAPGFGRIGDLYGLRAVMYTIASVSLLGTALAFFIPKWKAAESVQTA